MIVIRDAFDSKHNLLKKMINNLLLHKIKRFYAINRVIHFQLSSKKKTPLVNIHLTITVFAILRSR